MSQAMASGRIRTGTEGEVARLTLANPARRNAIDTAMWAGIAAFAEELGHRDHVRAVVVAGGEGVFSAGADIGDFESARAGEASRAYDDTVEAACEAIAALRQPTVAAVEGACIGAGASLALACDLRVAAEGAYFATPAARLGLGYDPRGVARLLRTLGPGATHALLYAADRLPAERAHALGAVARLVPAGGAEAAAAELAGRIAANAPLTVAAAKLAVRAITGDDPALYAEAEAAAHRADASADYAEGRRAFAAKRRPSFEGR